jgi:hypothetical protein
LDFPHAFDLSKSRKSSTLAGLISQGGFTPLSIVNSLKLLRRKIEIILDTIDERRMSADSFIIEKMFVARADT